MEALAQGDVSPSALLPSPARLGATETTSPPPCQATEPPHSGKRSSRREGTASPALSSHRPQPTLLGRAGGFADPSAPWHQPLTARDPREGPKAWAAVPAWGWDSSTGSPGEVLVRSAPGVWLGARPRRCPTASSRRYEGQVRAAAGGEERVKAGGRAGVGYHFRRCCRGRGDGGRRSRSMERAAGHAGTVRPHATPQEPRPRAECGAVTGVPGCRPAGRVTGWKERAFAGEGWRTASARVVAGLATGGGEQQRSHGFANRHARQRGERIPPSPTLTRVPRSRHKPLSRAPTLSHPFPGGGTASTRSETLPRGCSYTQGAR